MRRWGPLLLLAAVLAAGVAVQQSGAVAAWQEPDLDDLGGTVSVLETPGGGRSQAAVVALGDTGRVLLWGGRGTTADSGLVYDDGAWRELPPAPGPSRFGAATAWTGAEAVVWGGSTGTSPMAYDSGGVAYDPATDRWRTLPTAPVSLFGARAAALEGGLLVTGGQQQHSGPAPTTLWLADGADSWVEVPTGFMAISTAADGDGLLATGPVQPTGPAELHPVQPAWAVQRFDPTTLTWQPAADDLDVEWAALAVAANGTLTAVTRDGLNEPLIAYRWTGERWEQRAASKRAADGLVLIELVGYPPVTEVGGGVLHLGGQQGLTTWDPDAERFAHRSDRAFRTFGGTAVWTGQQLVAPTSQEQPGWIWTPGGDAD